MSAGFARALPFGATILDDGRVRFRLWAPSQTEVGVAIEGAALVPMHQAGDGWFEATARCSADTRYRYQLADGTLVPDPAARAQARRRPGDGDIVVLQRTAERRSSRSPRTPELLLLVDPRPWDPARLVVLAGGGGGAGGV